MCSVSRRSLPRKGLGPSRDSPGRSAVESVCSAAVRRPPAQLRTLLRPLMFLQPHALAERRHHDRLQSKGWEEAELAIKRHKVARPWPSLPSRTLALHSARAGCALPGIRRRLGAPTLTVVNIWFEVEGLISMGFLRRLRRTDPHSCEHLVRG